ncbi:MAG: PKD domain-containing protein [Methanospirillum sp.]|uniref:PKD domain-containing protein n=1 Tax=Methanospirillum sp. TaxID=45200 RepID=UPI00236AE05A|nr:PKD domain-containing protein [Methanospirillum sp.]MDD1727495.1 PKD domain-containing protein [Methanospirillum sp.]
MTKYRYDQKIAGRILCGVLIGLLCIGVIGIPVCADEVVIGENNSPIIPGEISPEMIHGIDGIKYPLFEQNLLNQEKVEGAYTSSESNHTQSIDMSGSGGNETAIQLTLQRCLGGSSTDQGYAVTSLPDGGYMVTGYTRSIDGDVSGNHGGSDVWVIKMDPSGTLDWQKCFGGSNSDYGYTATQTVDGGYLAGGTTYSNDGDVSGNHGGSDLWVVKMDPSGDLQWQKCLGGTTSDWAESVIQTRDGGYLAGGATYSNDGDVSGNHGGSDAWIVKLDTSGNLQWQKCLGGTSGDWVTSVIQTTDGSYLVAGVVYSTDGNVSGNHGQADYWIVNLDENGTLVWQKCFGGSDNDLAESITQTADGGYLIGGMSSSLNGDVSGNHGYGDYWVVKLDSSGSLQWQKCFGGSSSDWAESVIQTADGGYLVGGISISEDGDVSGNHGNSDCWVVKLDNEGNLKWQKCLGGSKYDHLFSLNQTADRQYLTVGYTYSNDGDVTGYHGITDNWLTRISVQHPVNATSDPWTILYPVGNKSYTEGTNATYLAQTKPGATLENVTVDSNRVGPVSNWTFTTIIANHTISTSGIPTPGQVHAFFSMNTTWGAVPLSIAFTNQSLGSPTSFFWNFGDGTTSTVRDPVHTYTTPGVYSVSLKAMNDQSGGIAMLNKAVTVTAGVVPSPTPTPVPAEISTAFSADRTSGTAPLQVTFTDQSTGNPTSWIWDLGDGNISTVQNVTHIYYAKGTYSVTLRTKNSISSGMMEKSEYISVT